eukprot:SAG31_NODE_4952_length_2837_cov_3.879474_5_plen_125_part_00
MVTSACTLLLVMVASPSLAAAPTAASRGLLDVPPVIVAADRVAGATAQNQNQNQNQNRCMSRIGVDYKGHDLLPEAQHLMVPSAEACCEHCRNHTQCVCWSRSEFGNQAGRCYLKSSKRSASST